MSNQQIKVAIPSGVAFSSLKLGRDPISHAITFDWEPIRHICAASNIDLTLFTNQHEDNVSGLIVTWYMQHRATGGQPDPIAEQLIAEVEAENEFGEANVISGAPKQ